MKTGIVGHRVVQQLERHGVARVYQVPGESFLPVLDGLYDSPIATIVARHEGGAGFMALAEGRLTGKPGIVMVTRGPGAANAMIAVHTAWKDSTPMVMFVGMVPLADRGLDAFQDFDLSGWFGSTTKAVFQIDDPDSATEVVARALDISSHGRPGPVVVGLPEDILHCTTAFGPREPAPPAEPLNPDLNSLREALIGSQRPLVIVGSDSWNSQGSADLRHFAENWAIPVAADYRTYDVLDNDSSSWIGSLGYGRSADLFDRLNEADLIVYIGATRSDILTDGFVAAASTPITFVASLDPELRSHVGRIDTHYSLSPPEFTRALAHMEAPTSRPWQAWAEAARESYTLWSTPKPGMNEGGVDLEAVLAELIPRMDKTIVSYGAGNYTRAVQRYLRHHRVHTLVATRNGSMGLGMPAGVAAGLVDPGSRPIVFAGDGCFGMTGLEFGTAIRYGIPAIVFVIDNSGFGTIADHQEKTFPGRPSGTRLVNPDFAAFAAAHGGHGVTISSNDQIPEALSTAFGSKRACIVHITTASI